MTRSRQQRESNAPYEGLFECPRCAAMAVAREYTADRPGAPVMHRLTCTRCGLVRERSQYSLSPDFGKVWLRTPCCGHELRVASARGLRELEDFIAADLRERRQDEYGWSNKHWRSRLPRWISSAANREKVLQCIQRLRARLLTGA